MKRILIPTDFSKEADAAFQFALDIATKSNGELFLIHAADLPVITDPMGPNINAVFTADLIKQLEDNIKNKLNKYSAKIGQIKIHTTVLWGNISFNILRQIESEKIDLVVMGTKGASGFKEAFVGSNTEKIIRKAPCPVISIKSSYNIKNLKNIVWGVDTGQDYDENFMRELKSFQNFFKAKLHLAFVNTPFHFKKSKDVIEELEKLAEKSGLTNYDIQVVNDSYEEEGLKYLANEVDADFIALGTHGRKGISHLIFGSIAEDINNHAKRPIWTYQIK